MLGAVVLYSTAPFVFAIGNSNNAPFLFAALIGFSSLISGSFFLVWFHQTKRENKTIKETLNTIRSKIYTKAFFWLSLDNFEFIFFAIALAYINVAVASILIAIQPIVTVAITAGLLKKHGRYKKITIQKWLLFTLAFIGAGFVVGSQSESFAAIAGDLFNPGAVIGISLVLISVLIGSAGSPYSLKLGIEATKETCGGKNDELFFSIAFLFVAWAVSSVLFFTIGVATNESFADINIYPAIAFGAFGQLLGSIFYRLAYLKTNNLGINSIRYLTPIITLVWLGLASLIDIPHFDWLVIGASAIIITNLLLNFETNIRTAYKVLIIVLWLFATVTYLISA